MAFDSPGNKRESACNLIRNSGRNIAASEYESGGEISMVSPGN